VFFFFILLFCVKYYDHYPDIDVDNYEMSITTIRRVALSTHFLHFGTQSSGLTLWDTK